MTQILFAASGCLIKFIPSFINSLSFCLSVHRSSLSTFLRQGQAVPWSAAPHPDCHTVKHSCCTDSVCPHRSSRPCSTALLSLLHSPPLSPPGASDRRPGSVHIQAVSAAAGSFGPPAEGHGTAEPAELSAAEQRQPEPVHRWPGDTAARFVLVP